MNDDKDDEELQYDKRNFGNGSEKYGIFDRFKSMKVNAPWIHEGIFGKE